MWPAQRIVREYTVLFDPPVFAPAATAAPQAPIAAPVVGAGERSGAIERPAPAPRLQPRLQRPRLAAPPQRR